MLKMYLSEVNTLNIFEYLMIISVIQTLIRCLNFYCSDRGPIAQFLLAIQGPHIEDLIVAVFRTRHIYRQVRSQTKLNDPPGRLHRARYQWLSVTTANDWVGRPHTIGIQCENKIWLEIHIVISCFPDTKSKKKNQEKKNQPTKYQEMWRESYYSKLKSISLCLYD